MVYKINSLRSNFSCFTNPILKEARLNLVPKSKAQHLNGYTQGCIYKLVSLTTEANFASKNKIDANGFRRVNEPYFKREPILLAKTNSKVYILYF